MRVMGRPVGILDRGAGVAVWETVFDSFDFGTTTTWDNLGDFIVSEVDPFFGDHPGWLHQDTDMGNTFRQLQNPLSPLPSVRIEHSLVVRNISMESSRWSIRDEDAASNMINIHLDWAPMELSFVGSTLGTGPMRSIEEIAPDVWLLRQSIIPANPGNSYSLFVNPGGNNSSDGKMVVYRDRIRIMSHWV